MSRERDGGIDEGTDARGGLGCTERDGELHLLGKVRERPEYDLREAEAAYRETLRLAPRHARALYLCSPAALGTVLRARDALGPLGARVEVRNLPPGALLP